MRSKRTCHGLMMCGLLLCVMTGFGGCKSAPTVQHYQMSLETQQEKFAQVGSQGARITLGVDDFTSESAYNDVRLIYRKSPYRIDYYHYHRWSAPPSMMVTDLLRVGFAHTDAFKAVTNGYGKGVDAVLRGRLVAIEEVDESEESWKARITLDLALEDGRSGEVLWSNLISKTRDVETLNPEGVTIALSQIMGDLVVELTPKLVQVYAQRADRPSTAGNDAF